MTTAGRLVLVTDLSHDDRDEDLLLAARLAPEWRLTLADPGMAASLVDAGAVDALLIRNAWPSSAHVEAFDSLERAVRSGRVLAYNPPSASRGYREDKRYLVGLGDTGFDVVPTYPDKGSAERALGPRARAVRKPFDGSSGSGVTRGVLAGLDDVAGVWQPEVASVREESYYFVDDAFSHALATGADRWDLAPHVPSAADLAWARTFVDWNGLPYGVQRIDGIRLEDGRLLLLEVEDFMPFLSLDALAERERDSFVEALARSLSRHVGPSARPRADAAPRP